MRGYRYTYLDVATIEMANRLITDRLANGYENQNYELFSTGGKTPQSFNCRRFGDIGRPCRLLLALRSHCLAFISHAPIGIYSVRSPTLPEWGGLD